MNAEGLDRCALRAASLSPYCCVSLSRPPPSFPFPPLPFLFFLLIFSLFSFRFISSPFPFLFIVMLLLLLFFLIIFLFSPPPPPSSPPPPPYPPGPPPGPLPPLLSPLLLLGVHSVVVAAEKVSFSVGCIKERFKTGMNWICIYRSVRPYTVK